MDHKVQGLPLEGYTVLDLTRARAGPTAARQLADFGADVIKIEMPGDPQYADMGTRHGPDFQNLHRNKRSIAINLKEPDGLKIFFKLAESADVVIENYRPLVKYKLGIDYDEIYKINPEIIYASISGFGQTGPYSNRPGLDQIAQGMGGHMSVTGPGGSGPWRSGTAISDLTAGILTANGILIGLLERAKSGKGQWLHTSLLEAQVFLMDFQAARWLVAGEVPPQEGNNHPTFVPMGTFKTKDGFVNIAPMSAMWPRFCRAMDMEELCDDDRFATAESRKINRKEVDDIIESKTILENSSYWIDNLNEAGIPCGPIYKMDEVFEDEQVQHLGIAGKVESNAIGTTSIVRQPINMDRTGSKPITASPELGEHTESILERLGYSVNEIDKFRKQGII